MVGTYKKAISLICEIDVVIHEFLQLPLNISLSFA